ncbi:MAG: FaeA/PapI family transcriptional regulator [Candidatus Hodarchaeaceae archaeon]|nr:FaeA/PapI family transcriptional regulator [Candidatus Hodarchaeaceae archaeon]
MRLRREEILKVLRDAGTPITLDELAQRTGIDIVRLRVDLYQLTREGKVERRLRGNVPVWTVKVSSPME